MVRFALGGITYDSARIRQLDAKVVHDIAFASILDQAYAILKKIGRIIESCKA
jgi:hypothetical protein